MKNLVNQILINIMFCVLILLLLQCAQTKEISQKDNFMAQVHEYLDSCSFNYYKIRQTDRIEKVTEYEHKAYAVLDSLAKLYPDSVQYGMVINDKPPEHEFKIQAHELAKIDQSLNDKIKYYSLLVEFESNGSCCEKLICAAYFKFNPNLKLVDVEKTQSLMIFQINNKNPHH